MNSPEIEGGEHDARDTEPRSTRSRQATAGRDRHWMRRAIELARRGRCGASPNPMVGAVVLDLAGELAGEGFHARCGGPHAEVGALAEAGGRARGGTVYVTLEPCAHHGRTPPCVDALIAAGVSRVVVAVADPNPAATGGIDRLRAEGIEVTEGVGSDSARVLNRRWLTWVNTRRPWVSAKAAISLDGRIATRTGHSTWITGEAARQRGLELREEHDAILVGVETVIADNPRLTRRLGRNPGRGWKRVVLDATLRTPSDAIVVTDEPEATIIAHTGEASSENRSRLDGSGVELVELPADDDGRVDVTSVLDLLGEREIAALLVEGGARVHGSFFDRDLVNEIYFFIAPIVIGGPAPSAVGGRGADRLDAARRFVFEELERRGDDLELHGVRTEDVDVHRVD